MRVVLLLFCTLLSPGDAKGQGIDHDYASNTATTNSFWDNWYVQLGADMTLQNPYGCNFKNVFPNGKSFGVDAALGKWFSPEVGVRAKLNWENGIFKNEKAVWMTRARSSHGGYMTLLGDFQINIHHLLGVYRPDRFWNLSVYPRAGLLLNLETKDGSPVLGLGISNTFRLTDKWKIYADIDYQAISSVLTNKSTGTGSGSHGYFDINVGVQYNIGYHEFHKVSDYERHTERSVALNSFWSNWFIQAGLGMSLLNPYGTNFANVFPNGKTFGVNVGLGKWFTPEIGLRGGLNWQNGIIGNKHLAWMDPDGNPGGNHEKGGYIAAYMDVFLNLHNMFGGYDRSRKWNAIVFPRAGLDSNREADSGSPLVGLGTEHTFRLNDRLKLFADVAYQVTTSEFLGEKSETGVNGGSNGWFDINIGVQYELGENKWYKPHELSSLSRVQTIHNWPRFIVNTGASVIVGFGAKTALKAIVSEERPDHSDNKSFPSGHATMAFAAARSIDKEFRKDCVWIPIAGYAAATAIGVERVVNKHHHWYDVVAGAGLGIGAAELTWWLSDLVFAKHNKRVAIGSSGNTVDVAVSW